MQSKVGSRRARVRRRFAIGGVGFVAIVTAVGSVGALGASAGQEDQVTICHRTDSVTNPYVTITVDESSVDGVAANQQGADHFGEHTGPLVTSEAEAQALKDAKTEWGDIIPPIAGKHDGLNYAGGGQAILENDCKYVTPSPTTVPTTTVPTTTVPTRAAPPPPPVVGTPRLTG
ncbi:MAG: hypothetical protein ACR2IR_12710 [Acidimicrobiia bacterium]